MAVQWIVRIRFMLSAFSLGSMKIFSVFLFLIITSSCALHHHTKIKKHWHSCDGEVFYTPIEYDEDLKSCSELLKEEILQELGKE